MNSKTYEVSGVTEFIEYIKKITSNSKKISEDVREKFRFLSSNNNESESSKEYYRAVFDSYMSPLSNDKNRILDNELSYSNEKQDFKFFYRGHYHADYRLIPSVFRGANWEKEDYYYHEIMVRCPEHFQYTSHLDKLVTMQHYDCPTRLLDVTSNPLVALYFACKNYGCKKCENSNAGKVFVFPVKPYEVAYSDSDKILMLSCLSRFSGKDKIDLFEKTMNYLSGGKYKQVSGGSRYNDEIVERFFHEIATELPSFKREIKPIDILRPQFVQPNKTNGRIIKQDGAFIINGLSKNENEAENKIEAISHAEIVIHNQKDILDELASLGIHESALFPEVDKVANYLKEQ